MSRATAEVRSGGWLVLSQAPAGERRLSVGQSFTLPSPNPTRFRMAALASNLGWAPGAIIMNASDYAQTWGSAEASAYNVLLAPGVSQAQGVRELTQALGPGTGLAVRSAFQRAERQRGLSRQGLAHLTQIAELILIGAVLAIAVAMGTMVWRRRPRLAKLKLEGFPRGSGAR